MHQHNLPRNPEAKQKAASRPKKPRVEKSDVKILYTRLEKITPVPMDLNKLAGQL
jgi:hypothetical protein